jgi:MerR family Zn(II)-responsive transcriptional regulator of zntA
MKLDRSYRIGEVAGETGVTVETLRFYEKEGLLPPALRSPRGARRYTTDVLARVRFIRQAQAVGLTLRDIAVLVKSRQDTSKTACRRTRAILAQRLAEIDDRVSEMQAFRDMLREHLRACDKALADERVRECPTLDAIEHRDSHVPQGLKR